MGRFFYEVSLVKI